jgi:SnoaL-like domain
VEWRPPSTSLDPEPRQGREAVRAYLAPDLFEEQTAEPIEVIEEGDRVLVAARVRARGRESGANLTRRPSTSGRSPAIGPCAFAVDLDRAEALSAFRGESEAR